MRKFTLSLLGLLALSSCAGMQEMTPAEFDNLKNKVNTATAIVSSRISQGWDQAKRDKALEVIAKVKNAITTATAEELDPGNVLRSLVQLYGDQLGLDDQARRDVRDASLIIELVTGPIKLDVGGRLDPRDQELVLAFLDGLEFGLA